MSQKYVTENFVLGNAIFAKKQMKHLQSEKKVRTKNEDRAD